MNELILSTYMQILQEGLGANDGKESCGRFLLQSVTDQPNAYCTTDLSATKISRLRSRENPVPDDIKQASMKPEIIKGVYAYFEDKVMKDLNPALKYDVFEKLHRLIEADVQVGQLKKKEFFSYYDAEEYGKFLADVFLYTLSRDNKKIPEDVQYQDVPFLDEVNYECPLTQERLVENIKGVPVRRYAITQIFPEGLPEDVMKAFDAIYPMPRVFDTYENLIALSERAANDYQLNPTVDEYKNLYEIKRILAKRYAAKKAVDRMQLEDDIRVAINALMNIPLTGMVPLEYEALKIEQKIKDDPLLKNEIQRQVLDYYRFIESVFKDSESDFDTIATEIKLCSLKLEKAGMSKEDVISSLADWIHKKTNLGNKGITACSIIVAFFIQNCEVFSSEVS